MADHASESTAPVLSNKTYDAIKWVVIYFLPAAGTLYFTLSGIWGLPNAEQVVGSIAAVTIFLSLILGLSKKSYNASDEAVDGQVLVGTDDEGGTYIRRVVVDVPLEGLHNQSVVKLKFQDDTQE